MLLTSGCATLRQHGPFHDVVVRRAVGTLLVATCSSLATPPAFAQTTASPSEAAPSERAKRDADKVFHWILIQGDRTRKAAAATAKDSNAKDERPAAKPARVAAPDVPIRPKAEPTVAAAEPASPSAQPATKPAARPADALAAIGTPPVVADVPKQDAPRLARVESAPPAAAPAAELSNEAPHGLVAIAQPAPQFPVNVMRTLRRGTVQVQFSVMTDGSVANLEVLKTTSQRLNAAALEAVGQWRFQPIAKMQTGAVEVGFDLD